LTKNLGEEILGFVAKESSLCILKKTNEKRTTTLIWDFLPTFNKARRDHSSTQVKKVFPAILPERSPGLSCFFSLPHMK
jgi:hypothetical protein